MLDSYASKELDRTFDEVLFLDAIFSESKPPAHGTEEVTPGSTVAVEKSDVQVEAGEGTISIADLFAAYLKGFR